MTTRSEAQSRVFAWQRALLLAAVVAAIACGWWGVARAVDAAITLLNHVAPLDGQEGLALWEAGLLRSGRGLYLPVVPDQFVSAPYPPTHPLLLALFGFADGPHVFWSGRIISLVAGVLVGAFGALLVRRVTHSWLAAIAATVLLLSFAPLQLWSLRIKPDMTGLALTVAGLWLVALDHEPRIIAHGSSESRRALSIVGRPFLILAAVAFVLAHFTKQTLLAGPLAVGTVLLLRDWRLAVRWGALTVLLLAAAWIALDLITRGQYTYHVWVLHRLPWHLSRFLRLTAQLRDTWPLITLSLLGMAATWRRPTVINAYVLWAPASLIGSGVVGANHNHLLETGIALSLAGAQAVGVALERQAIPLPALRVIAPVLLATQLLLWRTPLPWFAGDFTPDPDYARYIEFIRSTPGEVMADDVALVYAAGKPLPYDDPAAMGPAARQGLWDQSRFIADIRARRFSAILLPFDIDDAGLEASERWTPDMLQAIDDAYEIKFRDTQFIYVPRAATP